MTQGQQPVVQRIYHNDDIGGGCLIGDVIEPVQFRQVNGKQVANTKIKFIRVSGAGTQNQKVFTSQWNLEGWSDQTCRILDKVKPGTTIAILQGAFKNNKHVGQDGVEKWFTAINARLIAYMGPSTEAQFDTQRQGQGTQSAGGYQQQSAPGGFGNPPANGGSYGTAPAGNGGGGYGNTGGYGAAPAPVGNVPQVGPGYNGQAQHAGQGGGYGQQAAYGGQQQGGFGQAAQQPPVNAPVDLPMPF